MRQDYNKATRSASHSSLFSVPSVVKGFSSIREIRENPWLPLTLAKASSTPVQSSVTQEENHAPRTSIIAL
jgi:hypothetical protein